MASYLIPKGWYGVTVVSSVFGIATINFSDTVTLGSVLVAAMVVVAGGIATFRNNMRTFWRNLAEERQAQIAVLEKRVLDLNAQLMELQEQGKAEMAAMVDEQRSVRHELKAQLAASNQLLAIEHSKTDLTSLMEQLADQHKEAMSQAVVGLAKQDRVLELLAHAIPADRVPDDLRTAVRSDLEVGGTRTERTS